MTNKPCLFIVVQNNVSTAGLEEILTQDYKIQVYKTPKRGDEVIKEIGKLRPDVAIVDIPTDYKKGPQIARRIRKKFTDLPILAIDQHDDIAQHVNDVSHVYLSALYYISSGVDGHIMRGGSYNDKEIKNAVSELIKGGTYPKNPLVNIVEGLDDFAKNLKELTMGECPILVLSAIELLSNKEIARIEHRSVRTVEEHLKHIYNKLGVSGNRELIKYANLHLYGFMINSGL